MEGIIKNTRSYAVAAWIFMPIVTIVFEWLWNGYIASFLTAEVSYILRNLLLFVLIILTVNIVFKKLIPRYRRGSMLTIGILWMLLFIVFDLIFQFYILSVSPDVVLLDYNIFAGRLRGLVLLVMLFGPFFMVRTHIGDPDLFSMPIGKMATIGLLPSSL